ncbi:MAG: K(+)-transporting ATPase subunit C [Bacteroidetes bacterium]|nr:MAG: K(+)-transporting ATPase subunit C [Bacteroidota bacterium]
MKSHILPALRLTAILLIFFSVIYPLLIWGAAQLAPNQGKGFITYAGDRSYYTHIGQSFTADRYFYSRPSAVSYNAAGSAGSNKGPSNPDYLAVVEARIDSFLVHNPGVSRSEIPADLVTASSSGLDPHISPQAARVQAARIARVRQIPQELVEKLISEHIEAPFLGLFGPEKVHVLTLNLALDQIN